MNTAESVNEAGQPDALPSLLVSLLRGVLYRDDDAGLWNSLIHLQTRVREHAGVLGLDLTLDDAEGYAFLRSRPDAEDESGTRTPRLMARRPLSFPVSLMLALLRKKLAEFDAGGDDTHLVLSRDEIVEMVRVFLPESSNEARVTDRIDGHLNRIVELGFLRRMKAPGAEEAFEVRRILKAFVDAQWLAEFDAKLAEYRAALDGGSAANAPGSRTGGAAR